MIIDTHCHFDLMPNPEAFINECEASGSIVIGMTNLPSHFQMGYPYVRSYKYIRLALGLHPLLASNSREEVDLFKRLLNQTSYIGEIGLDFSKDGRETKDLQVAVLKELLKDLQKKKKIISVHSRKAERELFDLLCENGIENVIFHWYSGPKGLIPSILNQGYYFSVNEAMLLSNKGRDIISIIPRDRLLTETDAPFNNRCNIKSVLSQLNISEQTIYDNFKKLLSAI